MQDSLSRNYTYLDRIYRVSIVMYCLSNIKLSNKNLLCTSVVGFMLQH